MTPAWDWLLIIFIAGTAQPMPHTKPMPLPSKYACMRAEAQVQTSSAKADAVCVFAPTREAFDFFPHAG